MEWYYALRGGEQAGPVTADELKQLKANSAIADETLVWRDGLEQWVPYHKAFTAPAVPAMNVGKVKCAVCGQFFPPEETLAYQDKQICATCKPVFFQRLKEGVPLESGTISRKKKLIVMGCSAVLPDRCVKCNAPATSRLERKLHWHSPWLYLLILLHILVYAAVAICVRKKAKVAVGLCDEHRQKRKRNLYIGWGLALSFIPCLILGMMWEQMWLVYCFPFVLFAGIVYGLVTTRVVSPSFIDKDYIHLRGAGRSFLESLPEWKG